MSKKNLPRALSKVSTQRHKGLVAPIGAGATKSLRLKPDEEQIFQLAGAIDGLMPKHRLSGQAIGAAAAAVELARNGYGKLLIEEFARRTKLKPGTKLTTARSSATSSTRCRSGRMHSTSAKERRRFWRRISFTLRPAPGRIRIPSSGKRYLAV